MQKLSSFQGRPQTRLHRYSRRRLSQAAYFPTNIAIIYTIYMTSYRWESIYIMYSVSWEVEAMQNGDALAGVIVDIVLSIYDILMTSENQRQ